MTTTTEAPSFEAKIDWHQLPDGMTLHETPGVAVDAQDRVYALTRNTDNPVLVFEADGTFVRTFGAGTFSARTHAITIAPDGSVFCVDDGRHTVTKWTPDGELLLTIGTPDEPAERFSGEPFNRPTDVAIASDGSLYISDGYGNARVHHYSAEGELLHSWGSPGIDRGQFMCPHNIAIDEDDRLYVADRESHRVQVFDREGTLLDVWHDVHRPCGLTVAADGLVYIGELNGVALMDGAPGIGHRLSVYNRIGTLVGRFGAAEEGSEAGEFIAPHSVAVDSHGDVYVGEVSYTIRGSRLDPPRELKSLNKLVRTG
jgi:DNA-binding beta-propeller fold protein YncE